MMVESRRHTLCDRDRKVYAELRRRSKKGDVIKYLFLLLLSASQKKRTLSNVFLRVTE